MRAENHMMKKSQRLGRLVTALTGALAAASWLVLAQARQLPAQDALSGRAVGEIVAAARLEAALAPVAEKTIPWFTLNPSTPPGNYWMLQTDTPPLPFNPFSELMLYPLGDNTWLVDDRSVDYPRLRTWLSERAEETAVLQSPLHGMSGGGPPGPPGGGGGTNEPPAAGSPPASSYPTGALWLEITGVSDGVAALLLHGTQPDQVYEILSRQEVAGSPWVSETNALGALEQDWTPMEVAVGDRTNALFLRARSWLDSGDGGLPDWWQLEYFGQLGVDPYADGDGDGWSNLAEYQNGTSPTVFNAPPAVQGFILQLSATAPNTLSWSSPAVPPTSFTIEYNLGDGWQVLTHLAGTAASFAHAALPPGTSASYRIRANYPGGASAYTQASSHTTSPRLTSPAAVVSGPAGRVFLLTSQATNGLASLEVRADPYPSYHPKDGINAVTGQYPFTPFYGWTTSVVGFLDVGNFSGAPLRLSAGFFKPYGYYTVSTRGVGRDGRYGTSVPMVWYADATPLLDAREHILDNLNFALRSATVSQTFDFYFAGAAWGAGEGPDYGIFPTYTAAGFSWKMGGGRLVTRDAFDPLQPFEDGSVFRAFCFASNRFDVYGNPWDAGYAGKPTVRTWDHYFSSLAYAQAAATNLPPRQIDPANAQYIFFGPVSDGQNVPELGLTWDAYLPGWTVGADTRNVNGLRIQSVRCVKVTETPQPITVFTAPAGGALPALGAGWNPGQGWLYCETEAPGSRPVGYHVVAGLWNRDGPGNPAWSTINRTNEPVISVGEQLHMQAWAKLEVTNGSSGRLAYLQHYFDKAFQVDANGQVTTNETGVLSEYGAFFATEPGLVALTTKPNLSGGPGPTCRVHVIALSVDANHDGRMEFAFGGPDHVTPQRPFRFWVNDDNDWAETGGDDVPGQKAPSGDALNDAVDGVRDLVDFFPVYVNLRSVLQALPADLSVTCWLRHPDGALNYVDPSWYDDAELWPTNCRAFLTETNIAQGLGRVHLPSAPTRRITAEGVMLDRAFVSRIRDQGWAMLLVEGRAPTTNALVAEIRWAGQLVAQTQLPLRLTPVEEMFRHKNLIREVWPGSAIGNPDRLREVDAPNEPDPQDKNLVFLHGYNVNPHQARGAFAETFKRLYWSGSQARFYGVTWRGDESRMGRLTPNYHTNVANAFLTAPHLAAFLQTLTNGPTTVVAHSLGNMVALSALNDHNAPMANYFMLNAAVAIEALDGSVGSHPNMIHSDWWAYTNRLYASKWFQLFPGDDHRSTLTWSDRLADIPATDLYSFYSSGEEVLRMHTGTMPDLAGLAAQQIIDMFWNSSPPQVRVWAYQEKLKGRSPFNSVLGSTHAGWGFNSSYDNPANGAHMPPAEAAQLTDTQLRFIPFFDRSADLDLFTLESGSAYAQANRNRLLADAVPALTLPVGANAVALLGATRNFDMEAEFQNGWPLTRPSFGPEARKWYHSDFREVAYTFTWKLFDKLVSEGSLK